MFTLVVLLVGSRLVTPSFAAFCKISRISYNYPHKVTAGQTFTTTVAVSGVCAPDDADYYSIRADLNDMSGLVLSNVSVPIGYSQGQNWNLTLQNHATAPASAGPWQVQFSVYVFAAIGSGSTLDSVTFKPVTIQVGTS